MPRGGGRHSGGRGGGGGRYSGGRRHHGGGRRWGGGWYPGYWGMTGFPPPYYGSYPSVSYQVAPLDPCPSPMQSFVDSNGQLMCRAPTSCSMGPNGDVICPPMYGNDALQRFW